jgi:hypothetical protein
MNEPLAFARTIVSAQTALDEEVDPVLILAAAGPIREVAPNLCARLEAKARRAFVLRSMLRLDLASELRESD